MKKLISLVVLAMILSMTGCGEDTEEFLSCYDAVSNFHDNNCSFSDGYGNILTFNETLAMCREMTATAPTSCKDEVNKFLKCLLRIGSGEDCYSCNDEIDRLFYCD